MTTWARGIREWQRLWNASPLLMGAGLVLLSAGGLSVLGLLVDSRIITGSPAWLKPTKFAASSATYCFTVAWLLANMARPTRLARWAGAVIAVVLLLEVGIIDLQAARGTTSHFNIATPLDTSLFAVMGLSIAALLGASAVVVVELWRAAFEDRVWGWALRMGMLVTVVGSTTGGVMLRPTADQLSQAKATGAMLVTGTHTIGGRDGGAGLPVTGWSRQHGDLRVPHFFGLHALQAIPLLVWLAGRGLTLRSERARLALVLWVAASYSALIALLTLQALAGRSVVAADLWTLAAYGGWLVATAAGLVALMARERSRVLFPAIAVGA